MLFSVSGRHGYGIDASAGYVRHMSARTVVLVHGNPETSAIWGPLAAALDARGCSSVVTLSPPGFGAPVPDGFDPTMDAYAEWLIGELASIRSNGVDIDLVGHDWGAGHVYGALARRPDLVRTWVGDIAGVLHTDYVWHDMAQAWQTTDVGEQVVAGFAEASLEDRTSLFVGLGAADGHRRRARRRDSTPRWDAASSGSTARGHSLRSVNSATDSLLDAAAARTDRRRRAR
jgi:pimeloyl-ACP methyl ester carboxylesterase